MKTKKDTSGVSPQKNFKIKNGMNSNTATLNSAESNGNLPHIVTEPAKVVKFQMSAIMAKEIVAICAADEIFIDFAGFLLLQKFFSKFYAMFQNKKKITLEKLNDTFLDIFHKEKHCTQTKDAVLFAGEFACAWCAGTSLLENFFAQVSCAVEEF